jgi:SAM-dependent methyltransferase
MAKVPGRVKRARRHAFTQLLGLFPTGRLVDLGAGHGRFSLLAADMGWDVTAVDARTKRFPDDPRPRWVRADVRDVDLAPFDVIACLGLFYHLALEDQLDLLARASHTPTIIDTHLDHGVHEHDLSEQRQPREGYTGRFYAEPRALTSAVGNRESFWPTLETFHRMLHEAGFTTVLTLEPWITGDRTFFLALPPR